MPCRINLRRVWTNRIMLEASFHTQTSFLTLTYNEESVPKTADGKYTLRPKDYQNFFKRLRHHIPPSSLRYYIVGEYGHDGQRQWNPHYHAALFGFSCLGKIQRPDTYPRCYCANCELLSSDWGLGNITQDDLNDTTAAYTCGYVIKKMSTKDDVRLEGRYREFGRPSRYPGIGFSAVEVISDALRAPHAASALQFGDVPNSLMRGTSRVPLGRYLKNKLRSSLGIERINPETGEITIGAPYEAALEWEKIFEPELSAVQDAIKETPLMEKKGLYEKLDTARAASVSRRSQKILNLETKHKIFESGKVKKL